MKSKIVLFSILLTALNCFAQYRPNAYNTNSTLVVDSHVRGIVPGSFFFYYPNNYGSSGATATVNTIGLFNLTGFICLTAGAEVDYTIPKKVMNGSTNQIVSITLMTTNNSTLTTGLWTPEIVYYTNGPVNPSRTVIQPTIAFTAPALGTNIFELFWTNSTTFTNGTSFSMVQRIASLSSQTWIIDGSINNQFK